MSEKNIVKKVKVDKKAIRKLARISYINKSVSFLKEAGLYYEAILLSSQVMEFTLKDLIKQCEEIIQKTVEKKTVVRNKKNLKLDDKTLGKLIGLAEERVKNNNLIKDLKEFNEIRNKIAHNFITAEEEIKEIENNCSKYVKSGKIFNLLKNILNESNKIRFKQWEIDLKSEGNEVPKYVKDNLKKYGHSS